MVMGGSMARLLILAISPILWATDVGADRYSDCKQTADPQRSIRGCTAIIQRGKRETQKNRSIAFWSRGNTYHLERDFDQAIADYTNAIQINPEFALAYYARCGAYRDKGDYSRALADANMFIEINPRDPEAYSNRGSVYVAKGDKKRAVADYRKALEIDPSNQMAKIALKVMGVAP